MMAHPVQIIEQQAYTPGPWQFERMDSAVEFAALKGEALEEHEGYFRDNNGDWIVTWKDPDPEGYGGRIAAVSFKGSAKRGQAYGAPDPEGMANARLIATAPELLSELAATALALDEAAALLFAKGLQGCAGIMAGHADRARALIAKAGVQS